MKTEKKSILFLKLWGPVILWCSLIFILSDQPNLTLDLPQEFFLRKTAHMIEYAILTFFLFRALYKWPRGGNVSQKHLRINSAAISVISVFLFAISDEFHQTFVIGRSGTPFDVM